MLLTMMLTSTIKGELLAGGTPSPHIKVLPPHQPVHPALLRPTGHEPEAFTGALTTGSAELLPEEGLIVTREEVPAEALGVPPEPGAFGPLGLVIIGDLRGEGGT
jgi:hypothetical protein